MTVHDQPRRYAYITLTFIGINVLIYLIQIMNGGHWFGPTPDFILAWGGNSARYTLLGQPWRLLTSMFLHIGLLHLAVNMYMLFNFGSQVEQRIGHVRFLLVYLLAGLTGSLVSALWHASASVQVIGAGASGALMGLCGAYLAYWIVAQLHNDPHGENSAGGPLVQTILINLAIGAAIPGIDNACHVGGLLGGFVIGGAFALVPATGSRVKRGAVLALICVAALAALYARVNAEPSAGLVAIKKVMVADQARQAANAAARRAHAQREQAIAEERRRGPRTVSPEIAAGKSIALPSPVSSFFLMPDNQHIAVTGAHDHSLRLIDLANRAAGPAITGRGAGAGKTDCLDDSCIPRNANALALTADQRTAYVASMVTNGVGIVDLNTGSMVGSFHSGSNPRALAINQAGDRAYVLNDGDNTVAAIDLVTRKILGKPVAVGTNSALAYHPVGLWLAANDTELWVMDESASRLLVLNAATLAEVTEIIVSSGYMNGVHLDQQRGKVWVAGVDSMDLIDIKSKKIEKTARFCYTVREAPIAINQDGSLLAIAEPDGWVRIVSLRTAATLAAYPYQGTPIGLRFSPDGKQLYFIANEPARLTVFDTSVTQPLNKVVNAHQPELFCTLLR